MRTLYNEPIYEGDDEEWPGCKNQFDNASFSARTLREPNNSAKTQNDPNKENGSALNGLNVSGQGFTLKPIEQNGGFNEQQNGYSFKYYVYVLNYSILGISLLNLLQSLLPMIGLPVHFNNLCQLFPQQTFNLLQIIFMLNQMDQTDLLMVE